MKRLLFLLSAIQAIAPTKIGKINLGSPNRLNESSLNASNDSFELKQEEQEDSNYLYDISRVFDTYVYYDGDTYVKLSDCDNGYDKSPRSESCEYFVYGENGSKSIQTYKFCALYKCPTKQYKYVTGTSQVVNNNYVSMGVTVTDSASVSFSSSVTAEIGINFGGFVEAGVKAGLATEFGMETGTSVGAEFEFSQDFKSQRKIFDLNVYEVYEKFIVITYEPTIITTKKSSGALWWYKEWDEIDHFVYTKKRYLLQTFVELVFDYNVR